LTPNLSNPHRLPPYPRNLDSASDEFVQAVRNSYWIDRRLPLGNTTVADQGYRVQANQQEHPA
jgi:hypothetical protein